MGKRSSAEVVEEMERDSEKKAKKEKKEKKKHKEKDAEAVVAEVPEAVEETSNDAESSEVKKISEDDYDLVKPLFKKWLKEEKEMLVPYIVMIDSMMCSRLSNVYIIQ